MDSISIKNGRQSFAKLVDSAQQGKAITITRRGKPIAQITPVRTAKRSRLPDLSAFRSSLGKPTKKSTTVRDVRDQERY